MDQQNNQQPPAPPPAPVVTAFSFRNVIPGILIGILIGIGGILAFQKQLPAVTKTLYAVTLVSFGVLILTFVLLFGFRQYLTRFLFGSSTANAGDLMADAQKVSDALTDQFADKLLTTAPADVRQRVRFILPRLANWFVWGRLRNWWWNWILGIFVSLGGITGTLLLMNQNELLQTQNEMIQRQMQLEEASRRSALVVLMSNIFDKVDREIESQQLGLSLRQKEKKKYTLSQSLIGQIAALSLSFKPYRYLEGDTLIERPLSPERGQLLITLTLLPLDISSFNKIYQSSTFAESGLEGAILRNADLRGADLRGADLRGANLGVANLYDANLGVANLSGANLYEANLHDANLIGADLSVADLGVAYLRGTDLSGAEMFGADLRGTDLRSANLRGANLIGADLRGAQYSINQALSLKSLWLSKGLLDSSKVEIARQRPDLLIKPEED